MNSTTLAVQEYLRDHTLEDLTKEYAIKVKEHETLPLVILNYHQGDSPKTPQVVRECRGLVLERDTWAVIARAFNRFFNWGEIENGQDWGNVVNERDQFDFSDFTATSKEDGSLILCYWYDGEWRINTRQSFADGCPDGGQASGQSWAKIFCRAAGIEQLSDLTGWFEAERIPRDICLVFELCSRYNKIVRDYQTPTLFLLTVFCTSTNEEWPMERTSILYNTNSIWAIPNNYSFSSIDEIIDWINEHGEVDPTFEGLVIRDRSNHRWKIKSATYMALHRLKAEGGGFSAKNVVPLILAGETAEILTYFPEMTELVEEMTAKIDTAYRELRSLWALGWEIPQAKQKKFALLVKENPFASILFTSRKNHGESETEAHLLEAWRQSDELILKRLFRDREKWG